MHPPESEAIWLVPSESHPVAAVLDVRPTLRRAKQAGAAALVALLMSATFATTSRGSFLHQHRWYRTPGRRGVTAALSLWANQTQRARRAPPQFGTALAVPPACQMGELPKLWRHTATGPHLQVKLLTYNLFWWSLFGEREGNHGSASRLIAQSGQPQMHDVMAFQECMDPDRVLREAGLSSQYTIFPGDGSGAAATCMAFHTSTWTLMEHGSEYVAEDKEEQYFGRRAAQWLQLRHKVSGHGLFFMNHHGPLPVNSGGQCGGRGTAYNLLQLIAKHAQHGEAIILVGDFNADAASATIRHLEERLDKAYEGSSLGGIDNVFSNLQKSSVVEAINLGKGGSDHDALSVIFEIGRKPPGHVSQKPPGHVSPATPHPSHSGASITMIPQAGVRSRSLPPMASPHAGATMFPAGAAHLRVAQTPGADPQVPGRMVAPQMPVASAPSAQRHPTSAPPPPPSPLVNKDMRTAEGHRLFFQ